MVSYKYDSYGNIKQISGDLSLGKLNPFRYKGYYYDNESGMYYCKSRYYVAYWLIWLNMDRIEYLDNTNIGNINLFSYCNNNPVMMIDDKGNFGIFALIAITLTSSIIGGVSQIISNSISGKKGNDLWQGVAGTTIGAGLNALLLCTTMGAGTIASSIISGGISAIMQTNVDMLENTIRGENVSAGKYWTNVLKSSVINIVGNVAGSKIIKTNAGWFQTKKAISVFTKPYGQKILAQSLIGSSISSAAGIINNYAEELIRGYL